MDAYAVCRDSILCSRMLSASIHSTLYDYSDNDSRKNFLGKSNYSAPGGT